VLYNRKNWTEERIKKLKMAMTLWVVLEYLKRTVYAGLKELITMNISKFTLICYIFTSL